MQRIAVAFIVHTSLMRKIFIHISREVRCCAVLDAKGFAVKDDLLQVVPPAGDTLVAVGVESVVVDASTTVHAGVNLGAPVVIGLQSAPTVPGGVAEFALMK